MKIGLGIGTTFRQKWVPSLTEQIRSLLFSASEQGAWYDPSDLSTMYQDAAGALPVYAPGQGQVDPPVGLWLDKRPGLVRGPELLMNGDFAAGNASWGVAGADATHVVDFTGGACRYKSDTASPVLTVSQGSLSIVAGRWYELTIVVSNWVSGSVKTDSFNGAAPSGLMLASSAGTFRAIGLATASTSVFSFLRNSANVDLTIDSISIRELPGNHAYQTTTTSRPTLSARYNLLTNSNWSGAAVGAPGTAPTGWASNFNTAAITGVSQLGSDYAIQITAAAQRLFFSQSFNAPAGTTCSLSCLVVENSGLPSTQIIGLTNQPSGSTINWYVNGAPFDSSAIPPAGARLELRLSVGATAGTPAARFGIGTAVNATGAVSIAQPDVRVTNDGVGLPPYQRVINAETYDTMGFPLYLRFDGVDDWLQTASVDFSGTDKIFLASALRKFSDASSGIVVELTTNSSNFSGTFMLAAPSANGVNKFRFISKGTVQADATTTASMYSAPYSAIVVCSGDIGGAAASLRVNGAVAATSSAAQGTGNFTSAVLYIGRRGDATTAFNGRLYSMIIRGAATPDATIVKVERYLNSKARIA